MHKLVHLPIGCHLTLNTWNCDKIVSRACFLRLRGGRGKHLPQRGAGASEGFYSGEYLVCRKLVGAPPLDDALDRSLRAGAKLRVRLVEHRVCEWLWQRSFLCCHPFQRRRARGLYGAAMWRRNLGTEYKVRFGVRANDQVLVGCLDGASTFGAQFNCLANSIRLNDARDRSLCAGAKLRVHLVEHRVCEWLWQRSFLCRHQFRQRLAWGLCGAAR